MCPPYRHVRIRRGRDASVRFVTPSPEPVLPAPEPVLSWIDVAGFWVSVVGTAASTVIAVVAVVLTVITTRRSIARDNRDRREAWARDFSIWLDSGLVHMYSAGAAVAEDQEWVQTGHELSARADLLTTTGAKDFMVAAKDARVFMEQVDESKRFSVARFATNMLKLWASQWVDEPNSTTGDILDWLKSFVASGHAEAD